MAKAEAKAGQPSLPPTPIAPKSAPPTKKPAKKEVKIQSLPGAIFALNQLFETCWQVEDAEQAVAMFVGTQQIKGHNPVTASLQLMNDVSDVIEGFGTTQADDLDDNREAWIKSVVELLEKFAKNAEEAAEAEGDGSAGGVE